MFMHSFSINVKIINLWILKRVQMSCMKLESFRNILPYQFMFNKIMKLLEFNQTLFWNIIVFDLLPTGHRLAQLSAW